MCIGQWFLVSRWSCGAEKSKLKVKIIRHSNRLNLMALFRRWSWNCGKLLLTISALLSQLWELLIHGTDVVEKLTWAIVYCSLYISMVLLIEGWAPEIKFWKLNVLTSWWVVLSCTCSMFIALLVWHCGLNFSSLAVLMDEPVDREIFFNNCKCLKLIY